jgi:predicted nucleic acid-binding Zn ribbon protein
VKKTNNYPIKEAIDEFLKTFKLEKKIKEQQIIQSWETVVGKGIDRYTEEIRIKDGVMFVKLRSSVVRDELSYSKEKLLNALNSICGQPILKDIVLM